MPSVPPPETVRESTEAVAESRPSGPPQDEPPWSTWAAPAAVVLGFAGGVFATVLVSVLSGLGGSSIGHPTPAVTIIGDTVFDLAFVGSALYFASLNARPRPADFGFRRPPLGL